MLNIRDKLALSIPEACELSGVRKDTIYAEINAGRLQTAKINRRRVIRRAALDQWLADRESETVKAMNPEESSP